MDDLIIINGPRVIPHSSYNEWRNNTLGLGNMGFNFDNTYGCQCWDYAAFFWYSVGFPSSPLYPMTGPNQAAAECWTVSRFQNTSYDGVQYFDLINEVMEIKEGDVIVFSGIPGHIAFADEDYQAGSFTIRCVGQNQGGGYPTPGGGTTVSVNNLLTSQILGAFRYRKWHTTPPHPAPSTKPIKKRFPWCIYARKFRNQRAWNVI